MLRRWLTEDCQYCQGINELTDRLDRSMSARFLVSENLRTLPVGFGPRICYQYFASFSRIEDSKVLQGTTRLYGLGVEKWCW